SEDGTARVWEAASGRPVGPPLAVEGTGVFNALWSPDGRHVLIHGLPTIIGEGKPDSARLWSVLSPTKGTPEQIALWLSLRTGLELDERGAALILGTETWHQRRQKLEQLGGPPLP